MSVVPVLTVVALVSATIALARVGGMNPFEAALMVGGRRDADPSHHHSSACSISQRGAEERNVRRHLGYIGKDFVDLKEVLTFKKPLLSLGLAVARKSSLCRSQS